MGVKINLSESDNAFVSNKEKEVKHERRYSWSKRMGDSQRG